MVFPIDGEIPGCKSISLTGLPPGIFTRGPYQINDDFYRTLALGLPLDAVIQMTRNAISMEVGLDLPDFATPVLFMRAKDGVILRRL